jgi:DNA modification methylase
LFDFLLDKKLGVVACLCSLEQFFIHKRVANIKGFEFVYKKPIIWIKASAGQPYGGTCSPTSCYETFVYASRSRDIPLLILGHPDWFNIPRETSEGRIHPTQKPVKLFTEILNMCCFPNYKFIDPFAGSAASLIAAKEYGLKTIYGFELNEITYKKALSRLHKGG